MQWFAHFVEYVLGRWGYLALCVGLLGEDAGLPLPGETTLMYASYLARKHDGLSLQWVVIAAVSSAILGDNLGYWAGRHFGPRLLNWLKRRFHMEDDIAVARKQIKEHGSATVFWARYIFGLRTVAGPVAGALGMDWKRFLLFNCLGAATWVTAIAMIGYFAAGGFHSFAGFIEKVTWGVSAAIFAVGYWYWRKKKKEYKAQNA